MTQMPDSEGQKQVGGQHLTWQRSIKDITKPVGAVGAPCLPGWGLRDPHCSWLETLQDVAADRCCLGMIVGAPESILDRCTQVRTPNGRVLLTPELKDEILRKLATYATGRETLRCLALASRDDPPELSQFNLTDPTNFKEYETSHFTPCRLFEHPSGVPTSFLSNFVINELMK
ncbi:hypothetical protein T265_11689 [Opisthorchis viverrini]|uniref:Uncharacterized protein n=1 Tax=Opisthorchis viverrini TaxID=6198 RepID=A0A074Z256_OPIVI|nr:hypothetical protein T265_11689 [Opisthorchis viverrini]KER19582.1 hypothetical protein T265_11689 [Opisthorchis viverrini]